MQAVSRGDHTLQQIPERHRSGDGSLLQGGQGGYVPEQEAAGVQLPAERAADQPELDRRTQDRAVPRHRRSLRHARVPPEVFVLQATGRHEACFGTKPESRLVAVLPATRASAPWHEVGAGSQGNAHWSVIYFSFLTYYGILNRWNDSTEF